MSGAIPLLPPHSFMARRGTIFFCVPPKHVTKSYPLNLLNAKLNPICHLLALLGAHHILHISRIRVKHRMGYYSDSSFFTSVAPVDCCLPGELTDRNCSEYHTPLLHQGMALCNAANA